MSIAGRREASSQRKIAFAAPETIHGALKQIVGWAEMNGVEVNGRPLTERDFINSLIAGFWFTNRDQWERQIDKNLQSLDSLRGQKGD